MELHHLLDRVIRPHVTLIAVTVVVTTGLAFVLRGGEGSVYTASTRIVLDTPDPKSRAESAAIADTARAIATSPGPVQKALRRAGLRGKEPARVAAHSVGVRALGSSGVLQLSVGDHDPAAAAAIANALAAVVIETRLKVTSGEVAQVVARFDNRIAALSRQIVGLDTSIDRLSVEAADATGTTASVLQAKRNEAVRSRDFLAQQRAALEAERVGLLSEAAGRPRPTVISRATPPRNSDPSGLVPVLALGAVLGLVLGLGAAGVLESIRPTLHGGDAIAKELRVPLLGTLPAEPTTPPTLKGLRAIGGRLRLAADAAGVKKVGVMGRPEHDIRSLARRLELAAAGLTEPPETLDNTSVSQRLSLAPVPARPANGHGPRPDLTVVPFGGGAMTRSRNALLGVVLVAPETLPRGDLVDVEQMLGRGTKVRLVGVIAYRRSRKPEAHAASAGERR